jgi:hypothetical protein
VKFRKKPVEIEARQFDGSAASGAEIVAWAAQEGALVEWYRHLMDGDLVAHPDPYLRIVTLEGAMSGSVGDWIIRGVQGEFYPCKPDIFEATYERVEDES